MQFPLASLKVILVPNQSIIQSSCIFPPSSGPTAFHKNKLTITTLFITALWNFSHLVAPPLHPPSDFSHLGDFMIGFKHHFLPETALEFPRGQIWNAKENKKKRSSHSWDMPDRVQRPLPCPFSLSLPGRPPPGRTSTVTVSHASKVQSREERD